MERREFIKGSCLACMALGSGIFASSLTSCSSAFPLVRTLPENGLIPVDLTLFTSENKAVRVRIQNLEHDILVIRQDDGTFKALYLQCTHNHFDLSCNKNTIVCTSHGAEFDLQGNVTKGPAKRNLTTFPIIAGEGKIFVKIV